MQAQTVHHLRELMDELQRLDVDDVARKLDDSSDEVVNAACGALAARGEAAKHLADRIAAKTKDPKTRYNALCALSHLGVHHTNIVGCLSDADVGTRCAAVRALSTVPGGDAMEVRKLLKNADAGTRSAACLALGGMNHQNSAANLAELLSDKAEDSSWLASSMGGASARPPAQVRKPRCAAILALGMLGTKSYVSLLADLTTDSDWEARGCAVEALGNMGSAAQDKAGHLASCLDDDTYPVRAKACEALGKLGASQQVDRLADMLNDRSPAVRIEAIRALAGMGLSGQKYLSQVAACLSDALNSVKGAAARALAQMGESAFGYASAIAGMLGDEDPFLRLAALDVLPQMSNYGSAFSEEIQSMLTDQDATVRAAAIAALGKMGIQSGSARSGIMSLANDDDRIVSTAAKKAIATAGWADSLAERVEHE